MNEFTPKQAKKENESEHLRYFIEAYDNFLGKSLDIVSESERPDFICKRAKGKKVGIELAQIRRGHPNDIFYDQIVKKQEYMLPDEAIDKINETIFLKSEKLKEKNWQISGSNILVIELNDIPLYQIASYFEYTSLPDVLTSGFQEIWLADFTGIEAYDNLELFCLFPKKLFGYYKRPLQKPYG